MEFVIIITGIVAIKVLHQVYITKNICDYNKEPNDDMEKINDWEERCLSAGLMLPY